MPVEVWVARRQAALEGIGTCPISSSSNRSAIAEASLEEIIKSGEKVAKTSGMPPTGVHSAGVPQARDSPCQSKPF